jgi:hypothetical protein
MGWLSHTPLSHKHTTNLRLMDCQVRPESKPSSTICFQIAAPSTSTLGPLPATAASVAVLQQVPPVFGVGGASGGGGEEDLSDQKVDFRKWITCAPASTNTATTPVV